MAASFERQLLIAGFQNWLSSTYPQKSPNTSINCAIIQLLRFGIILSKFQIFSGFYSFLENYGLGFPESLVSFCKTPLGVVTKRSCRLCLSAKTETHMSICLIFNLFYECWLPSLIFLSYDIQDLNAVSFWMGFFNLNLSRGCSLFHSIDVPESVGLVICILMTFNNRDL